MVREGRSKATYFESEEGAVRLLKKKGGSKATFGLRFLTGIV